jgi:hypothetical protein
MGSRRLHDRAAGPIEPASDELAILGIETAGTGARLEDAFRMSGADDVSVRVAPGATGGRFGIDGPDELAA